VGPGEVEQITGAIDLLDREKRREAVRETTGKASMADTIAYNVKRVILHRMDEDPAFYKKFSEMLQEVIDAFRSERLAEAEYLKQARSIEQAVLNRTDTDLPSNLKTHDMARRYYGVIYEILKPHETASSRLIEAAASASLKIDEIISNLYIRDWTTNRDQQNRMRTAIEDYLFEVKDAKGIDLNFNEMDSIMDRCLDIAGRVMP
jgi:type I restriction enzyme R subunit